MVGTISTYCRYNITSNIVKTTTIATDTTTNVKFPRIQWGSCIDDWPLSPPIQPCMMIFLFSSLFKSFSSFFLVTLVIPVSFTPPWFLFGGNFHEWKLVMHVASSDDACCFDACHSDIVDGILIRLKACFDVMGAVSENCVSDPLSFCSQSVKM